MNEKLHHILVVDDDTRLRKLLSKYLSDNGFYVSAAKDAAQAREMMKDFIFDMLVVDLMMPNETGVEFTKSLRQSSKIPVLMLTAMGEVNYRIEGLEAGVDDYLPKPFEPKELLLRIHNILKRVVGDVEDSNYSFGDFLFDAKSMRLKKGDEYIHITETEAKILNILCKEFGEIVSREKISDFFGGVDHRTIDVQITRLRRKIEENPKQPHFLQTVRNKGYVLYN
ncbi:MAG: response regulator [Proteobacteria bacterium]|nr:response regulator [Pseudomonadota bacterium]